YVGQAHAKSDWSTVKRIAVDETSSRRGHRYVTNILDAENSRLLLMVEGRSAEALRAFAKALAEHGGDPSQIEAIAMDMSPAYIKGATECFPLARIVFDKFHVMVLAGQALDETRRELQRQGVDLKGAMWSLRGNSWNLSQERQEQRKNLGRKYTKLGRAMSLRETLQAIYTNSDRQSAEAQLAWWLSWAMRSRLSAFRDLAKTVREHWDGILAYFDTLMTVRHEHETEKMNSESCATVQLMRDKRPLGTGEQARVSNRLRRLGSKARVVSTEGKGPARTGSDR